VFIKKGGQSANAKTIMDVLMLAGTQGTQITVEATGEDEQEALDATVGLIAARFHESE
jgi:phosphotransferase system HPr (HPr) family protein